MLKRLPVLLALAFVFALTGCGSDDDSGDEGGGDGGGDGGTEEALSDDEQAYADAFAATLADDEDGLSVSADEADCMGTAIMAELGTEPFEEAEVTADEIEPGGDATSPGEILGDDAVSQEQAEAIVQVWADDCVDLVDVLIQSAGSELDLDPEGKQCMEAGLREDALSTRLMTGAFTSVDGTPDEETFSAFVALLEECGSTDGGPGGIVQAISDSLAKDGSLTQEQADCLAQGVVDELGIDSLSEMFANGSFEDLDATGQSEVTGALLQAAVACDVPVSAFGG